MRLHANSFSLIIYYNNFILLYIYLLFNVYTMWFYIKMFRIVIQQNNFCYIYILFVFNETLYSKI